MEFKVLSVLKKFMSEEQYEAFKEKSVEFETELNKDITKYVTANTPNQDDLVAEAKKTAHEEVIKELKIKDVETVKQLKTHMETVKLSGTEQASEVTRLTTELEDKTAKYDAEVKTRTQFEKKTLLTNQLKSIKDYNINLSEKEIEFMHWDLSKQVTEEIPFDTVLKTYAEANPIEEPKKYGHNPRFQKPQIAAGGVEDVGAAWREMRAKRNPTRK